MIYYHEEFKERSQLRSVSFWATTADTDLRVGLFASSSNEQEVVTNMITIPAEDIKVGFNTVRLTAFIIGISLMVPILLNSYIYIFKFIEYF